MLRKANGLRLITFFRTLSLSSAAFKLLLERSLSKLKACRAKNVSNIPRIASIIMNGSGIKNEWSMSKHIARYRLHYEAL